MNTHNKYFMYYFLQTINLFHYQTVRGIGALLTAFAIGLIFGKPIIGYLKSLQKAGQPIRSDGPQSHITSKAGTPTMGGILIILTVLLSTMFWANLTNPLILICILCMLLYGFLGFVDDYHKLRYNSSSGISARQKLIFQFLSAFFVSTLSMLAIGADNFNQLHIPFFKECVFNLSYFYLLWSSFVIVGSSNAVNLTDGLDGLAIFPVMVACIMLGTITYLAGHHNFANYLFIPYVPHAGELVVFLGSFIGASLAFLWFNAPPAKIFMGDTGSLSIGAVLGLIAVIVKHEFVWAIIGGIFVVEALSVILQVWSFKTRGKRILKMAPLHHHFEHIGWSESTIVIRFWIISVILAILGLALLKIR